MKKIEKIRHIDFIEQIEKGSIVNPVYKKIDELIDFQNKMVDLMIADKIASTAWESKVYDLETRIEKLEKWRKITDFTEFGVSSIWKKEELGPITEKKEKWQLKRETFCINGAIHEEYACCCMCKNIVPEEVHVHDMSNGTIWSGWCYDEKNCHIKDKALLQGE